MKKKWKIAVIGIGYVGLPLILGLAKKYNVIGYDINNHRIETLKKNAKISQSLYIYTTYTFFPENSWNNF